ncbi:MAG: hypothetical protein WCH99_12340 [Verrucomicrobiota bacterium]
MNTPFLTQRRKGAKVSFQESSKVFVKRAGHLRANGPDQCLTTSNWNNLINPMWLCGSNTVAEKNRSFNDLTIKHTFQPQYEKATTGSPVKFFFVGSARPVANQLCRFRVIGDAFDGFFHGSELNHGWTLGNTDLSTLRNDAIGEKCGNGWHDNQGSIPFMVKVHSTRATMPPAMVGVKTLKDYGH